MARVAELLRRQLHAQRELRLQQFEQLLIQFTGALRAEFKEELGRLSEKIAGSDSRMIRWMVGTAVASVGAIVTVAKSLH